MYVHMYGRWIDMQFMVFPISVRISDFNIMFAKIIVLFTQANLAWKIA